MGIHAYAAFEPRQELTRFTFEPDPLGPLDVEIAVECCGVCFTDLSLIDDQLFNLSTYPLVPGHEVVGRITARGNAVDGIGIGLRVGVGWLCGSCRQCAACDAGEPHLCLNGQAICVGRHGGFAERVRVDSRFVVPLPENIASAEAAPLMCAGITVFAPLDELHVTATTRVGVIGIGGLGHLALQFAKALGCEVTALSGSATKSDEARAFGADRFVLTSTTAAFEELAGSFDVLLATAEGDLPWTAYANLLAPRGTLWLLGIPHQPLTVDGAVLMAGRRSITGSLIGSPSQMQRMMQLVADKGIRAQTELMPLGDVNAAIERVRRGEARYRVVLTVP